MTAPASKTRFAIVTPVFNGARFLDETILSVLAQAGPFGLRYHVQDGGSTDGTVEKLAAWKELNLISPNIAGQAIPAEGSGPAHHDKTRTG